MAKKPANTKFQALNLKLPVPMMDALMAAMASRAGGIENISVTVRELLADGMRARMLADGVDPAFMHALTPEGIGELFSRWIDARLDRMGRPGLGGKPSRYYMAKPPVGGNWERLGVRGFGVLAKGTAFTLDDIAATTRDAITLKAMFKGLRSSNMVERLEAGTNLAKSIGAGLAISGASEIDAEHGIGRDLGALLGQAMAGDAAAVDELERVLTNDASKATATPAEAPTKKPSRV